jgi:trimethylamine--corrinoid protein Co-methyltransferase
MALDENGFAIDAFREVGPGRHFLGSAHTLRNYETAFLDAELADNNSFEQWQQDGSHDILWRATRRWQSLLAGYEPPPIDAATDEALKQYVAKRKAVLPDTAY